jgi:CHC2-type zinc finger protein/Toprim domain-containing protein
MSPLVESKTTQRDSASNQPDLRFFFGTPYGDSPIKVLCPFHEEDTPSFTVYKDGAKCYGCGHYLGYAGVVSHFGIDTTRLPDAVVLGHGQRKRGSVVGEDDRETFVMYCHHTLVRGPRQDRMCWFLSRGFRKASIERWQFGHDGDRFIIPIWVGDKLVSFKKRRDDLWADPDDKRKYLNERDAGVKYCRPNPDGHTTVICEGELDSYLLAQYGMDSFTSIAGSDSVAQVAAEVPWQWGKRPSPIYLALDRDPAGQKSTLGLVESLQAKEPDLDIRVLVWNTRFSDISEYLCSFEPGERATALDALVRKASS